MNAGRITAILVSWNDAGDLLAAIESLVHARARIPAGGPTVDLAVVINGASRVRRETVLALWPDAQVLFNAANRGFGPAANQAAELARGDVLLFLNPDTRAEGEPFSELADAFTAHPEVVAIAPRLLDFEDSQPRSDRESVLSPPGEEDQFTFQLRRLPTLAADARELLLFDHVFPNNPARRRSRYASRDRETPFEVEQAAAASLAVRADAFRRARGFAEEFVPAWYEDVDLCARLLGQGKILYWPAARFRHRGGVSSAQLGYARFLPILYRNALLYRRRHYGLPARSAYRGMLATGMLLRLAALPLRRRVPRSRAEAAQAYLSVLLLAVGLPPPAAR